MIPMETVKTALAAFVDREIAPGLTGWDKVIVAGGLAVMIKRLPDIIKEHHMLSALGVRENEVDIDALYEAAAPYVNEKMPLRIPGIGITMKLGKQELDTLYRYLKEAQGEINRGPY